MRWVVLVVLAGCTDPADNFVGTWRVRDGSVQRAGDSSFQSRLLDGTVLHGRMLEIQATLVTPQGRADILGQAFLMPATRSGP